MDSEKIAIKLAMGETIDRKNIKDLRTVIRFLDMYENNIKIVKRQLKKSD